MKIIDALIAKGYHCAAPVTDKKQYLDDDEKMFPFVLVFGSSSREYLKGRFYNVSGESSYLAEAIFLKDKKDIPAWFEFPEEAMYCLDYEKQDGERETYRVSNPIEETADKITCYAFGHGVRSFVKDRIVSFGKIKSH